MVIKKNDNKAFCDIIFKHTTLFLLNYKSFGTPPSDSDSISPNITQGNQKNADDRGFSQKSVFAGMLLPNQATGTADDRAEAVSEILVSKKTEEIRRNQVKKW